MWGRPEALFGGLWRPGEPTVARYEPERLALARKSPAPKVRKPGRKPPSPGPEKAEAAAGEESCGASAAPAASASRPGPTLKARFRSLLETNWLSGLALPTWGHKASRPDRPRPPTAAGQPEPSPVALVAGAVWMVVTLTLPSACPAARARSGCWGRGCFPRRGPALTLGPTQGGLRASDLFM
ncbi:hypothetical protein AAY473_027809 [Plecturocebus cupreus]